MFEVMKKEYLASNIVSMDVKAPRLAQKAMPGQFLIVKTDEFGERIPLTICDYDTALERSISFFKWSEKVPKIWSA